MTAISNESSFAQWEGCSRMVHDSFSPGICRSICKRRRFLESLEYIYPWTRSLSQYTCSHSVRNSQPVGILTGRREIGQADHNGEQRFSEIFFKNTQIFECGAMPTIITKCLIYRERTNKWLKFLWGFREGWSKIQTIRHDLREGKSIEL